VASRRRISRALLLVGAVATYLAVVAGYTRSALFDSQSFGDRAVEAVRAEPVRARIAEAFTDELIRQEPQLISARPVIISGAESVLASRASGGVISRAARDVHRGLLTSDEPSIVVDLADLSVLVRAYLQTADAELDLSRIERAPTELATTLSERTLALEATHVAARLSWIAFLGPIIALLAFAGSVAWGASRRRSLRDIGLAMMLVGALVMTTKVVLGGLVLAEFGDRNEPDLVLAIFNAFAAGLTWWALAIGGSGALLAAAAATLMGPVDVTGLPRIAWALATQRPQRASRQALRAAGLLLIGLLIIGSPQAALTLATTLTGGYLALVGLTTLLGLLLGPAREAAPEPGRRRLVVGTGLIAVLVPVTAALAIAATASSNNPNQPNHVQDGRCNGMTELCDRRLDQVVLPTVHNAMANAADGFLNANNGPSIESQLNMGIRGLLVDALAGQRNADGVVRTDLTGKTEDIVVEQIGEEGLAAAQRLAGRVAFGPLEGTKRLYLCHVLCELGAADAVTEFRGIASWLDRHPREVLMIFIQDEAPAEMITAALRTSGLADHAAVLERGRPLPTLQELIERDQRVVLLAENRAGAPWYPDGFEWTQETPFGFRTASELKDRASCDPNRGAPSAPLFLVNHWVESYPPNPRNAKIVNEPAFLLERARRCMKARDRVATMLAIDFPEHGDVVAAADTLNRELLKEGTP
jgi:hypothetical protein